VTKEVEIFVLRVPTVLLQHPTQEREKHGINFKKSKRNVYSPALQNSFLFLIEDHNIISK